MSMDDMNETRASRPLDELIPRYVRRVLRREGGVAPAARAIGVNERTVRRWIKRWAIRTTYESKSTGNLSAQAGEIAR